MNDQRMRLDSLQRSIERQRLALILLAMVACVPWLVAFRGREGEAPEELRVKLLEVVAEDGLVVFSAAPDASGNASLLLFNREGKKVVDVGVTGEGNGAADFFNVRGTRVVSVGSSNAGDGGVRTVTADGMPAFYMGHDLRGNGRVPAGIGPGARVD